MTLEQLDPTQVSELTRKVRSIVGDTPPDEWTDKQRVELRKALKALKVFEYRGA